jgi:hypothetical protein
MSTFTQGLNLIRAITQKEYSMTKYALHDGFEAALPEDITDWGDMEPYDPFSEPGSYEAYQREEQAYQEKMDRQQEEIYLGIRIA